MTIRVATPALCCALSLSLQLANAQSASPPVAVSIRRLSPSSTNAPAPGVPRSLAIGADDRVFIGDESPVRVLVFDSAGRFVRAIGREGSGPGEFRSPEVGAGRALIVNDAQLHRLSAFDDGGRLLWTKPGTCCRRSPIRVDDGGRIYVLASPIVIGGGPAQDDLVVFSTGGVPVDTLQVPVVGGDPKTQWRLRNHQADLSSPFPFVTKAHFAVTRVGAVVWGRSNAYVLHEGTDLSRPTRTVSVPWSPTPLPNAARTAAREAAIEQWTRFVDRATLERTFRLTDIPDRAPAFFGLDVDSCGRWWVLRTSAFMNGPTRFDVLSSTGVVLATMSISERLMEPGALWAVGGRHLAAIVEDATGVPSLGVYPIQGLAACAG